jgi:glycosyltransferase involved in cell wall biosynthesis
VPDEKPRVLFVGRGRYMLPLSDAQAKKWHAIEKVIDYRILGGAERGSTASTERFRLSAPTRPALLSGALFQARLPVRIERQITEFVPDVIICADPFICAAALVARRLARRAIPVIAEVHGDWRTFTRSYGAERRRLLSRPADAVAAAALRGADATRAVSSFTSSLIEEVRGEPATMTFQAYSDLSVFVERPVAPLPERPTALFVAMLEAYKNVDGLAAAWRRVVQQLPDARLVIVGKGSRQHVVEALLRDLPGSVEHHGQLSSTEVAMALDHATVLVLPSWPEGLGLVVIEAFARGRGVIATAAGGLLELVENGVEGILIPPADTDALVDALVEVLTDRGLAQRLGEAAHVRYSDWHSTPQIFARQVRDLVDDTIARSRT